MRRHLPAIISGLFIGTSYIPFPPWAAAFGFLPLWLHWIRNPNLKNILISGWICQFVLTLIGFNWVAFVSMEFGHLPLPVAILVLLAFCCFANLFVPLTGLIWYYLKGSGKGALAVLSLGPLSALLSAHVPTIFPWNFGYTLLWSKLPIYQLGDMVGFQGLAAFFHVSCALLTLVWLRAAPTIRAVTLIGIAAGFALLNLLGHIHGKHISAGDESVRVMIVQANIGNLEKQYAEHQGRFRDRILDQYFELASRGISQSEQPIEAMVWPETAFPDFLGWDFNHRSHQLRLQRFLREKNIAFWGGSYSEVQNNGPQTTNSIFVLNKSGEFADSPYHKTHLLIFGEFLPFGESFPWIKDLVPAIGDFARGSGPRILQYEGLRLGPQICYEGLFPSFSKTLADMGADLFLNVTNDSWFGTWQEPYQHLTMTTARAIEFRRPLIRSTNTGISTVVLRDGTRFEKSPLKEKWTQAYDVKYLKNSPSTFYQRFIWLTDVVLLVILIGLLGARRVIGHT